MIYLKYIVNCSLDWTCVSFWSLHLYPQHSLRNEWLNKYHQQVEGGLISVSTVGDSTTIKGFQQFIEFSRRYKQPIIQLYRQNNRPLYVRKRNNLVHSNAYGILVIENIISVPILVYPEMYWMHVSPIFRWWNPDPQCDCRALGDN